MDANTKMSDISVLQRLFNFDTPIVLYIGRKQKELSPSIVNYPWSCIVTSRQSDGLAVNFSETNKREVEELFTPQQVANNMSLGRRYLKFVHLLGADPAALPRIKKNNAIDMLKIVTNRMRSSFGSLVIIGYDPTDEEELPFERLADVLDGMRKESTFVFEAAKHLRDDQNFKAAIAANQITGFNDSLGYYLDLLSTHDDWDNQDDERESFSEESHVFFINGKLTSIEPCDLFHTQGFAKLLTTAELGDLSVPPALRKEYFLKFLLESTYAPMWFGYANNSSLSPALCAGEQSSGSEGHENIAVKYH